MVARGRPGMAYVPLGGRIAACAPYLADPLPSLARLRCSPLVNWWMYGKGLAAALARFPWSNDVPGGVRRCRRVTRRLRLPSAERSRAAR